MEDKPKEENKTLMQWARENIMALLLSITAGSGTIGGIGWGDVVYEAALTKVVADLDTLHNIKPLPPNLDTLMLQARLYQISINNTLQNHGNDITYLKGAIRDLCLDACQLDTIYGIPIYIDSCRIEKWVIYGDYVYEAVPIKKGWSIYKFSWEIPPGVDNKYQLDPLYYELR